MFGLPPSRPWLTTAVQTRNIPLIGFGPLASAKAARWIRANVPGIHIPDAIIDRLEGVDDQKQEGKRICIEIMQQIKDMPGIAGVHVMAYRQEELVAEAGHESGVLKDRLPGQKEPKLGDDAFDRADLSAESESAEAPALTSSLTFATYTGS